MPRKRTEQKEQHENYNKAFPKVMRHLMEQTTQTELATALGKTRQAITYYCDGSSSPDWETLLKIADYFNVTTDYLLGRTNEPSRTPCATDQLGLTPKAISAIAECHDSDILSGLSSLLEDRRILGITGQITQLAGKINEYIDLREFYRTQIEQQNKDVEPNYWKFVIAAKEHQILTTVTNTINSEFPNYNNEYTLVMGSELIAYKRRYILDTFDEILRKVSNYNEFSSGVLKMEDIWE